MDTKQFAITLSRLRKEKNLTQKELAIRFCVSDKTVSKWERGESMPDITLLPDIANFFGISVDDLLSGKIDNGENTQITYFSDIVKCKKRYFIILILANIFLLLSLSCLLIAGKFTQNGIKDILFSFSLLCYLIAIVVNFIFLAKKYTAQEIFLPKKYYLILLCHCLVLGIIFSLFSGLFYSAYQKLLAMSVIIYILITFLCFAYRDTKLISLLVKYKVGAILPSAIIAGVCFFAPLANLISVNPDLIISVDLIKALETLGLKASIPVFYLLVFASAYTAICLCKNLPSWTVSFVWTLVALCTVIVCDKTAYALIEQTREYFSYGIQTTLSKPFLIYASIAILISNCILCYLSKKSQKP